MNTELITEVIGLLDQLGTLLAKRNPDQKWRGISIKELDHFSDEVDHIWMNLSIFYGEDSEKEGWPNIP